MLLFGKIFVFFYRWRQKPEIVFVFLKRLRILFVIGITCRPFNSGREHKIKMSKNMNDNGKIATALLAGLAVGAVVGLLFAPDKGSETRDKINESLSDLGDAIKERAEEQFGQLSDLKDKLVGLVKSKVAEAESIVDDEIEEHA